MSRYVVGVDGGGSRTRALVLDPEGRELARVEGPPAPVDPRFPERAAAVVEELVREAVRAAGGDLPAGALWAGLAGAGRETARAAVEQALARGGVADRVTVGTDVEAAFHDAFSGSAGVLLLAGTGSMAWGRGEDGREARVGGWGSILGDEGSGYAMGVEALRRVVRLEDGRGLQTGLRGAVLAALALESVDELVAWTQGASRREVAALVPLVAAAARGGDAVAGEILVRAVEELESHILALLTTLGPWSAMPRVALAGGLLDPGGPLRKGMEAVLSTHPVELRTEPVDPVMGAARLAMAPAAQGDRRG